MTDVARTCIVVPAYNEADRLDVAALDEYLGRDTPVSFVLVNDGSSDGTLPLLESVAQRWSDRVEVLNLPRNQGKAEAVRQGMLRAFAGGDVSFVGFWDADWATPLSDIDAFVACLANRNKIDMLLGARVALLGRHIDRKLHRHYLGRVAATVASLVLWLPVYDTQCGAKLFRASAGNRALFNEPFCSRWVFDVELIARYTKLNPGKPGIYEFPLDTWRDIGASKVRPVDFVRAIGELAKIYRKYRLPQRYHWLFDVLTAPFVRYAGAGGLGTVAHYVALAASVEGLGLLPPIAASLGALVGAVVNYFLNYHFTFTSTQPHRATLPKFFAVALLGIVLTGLIVQFGVGTLRVHYVLAQIGATFAVLVVGFVLNKVWTFAQGEGSRRADHHEHSVGTDDSREMARPPAARAGALRAGGPRPAGIRRVGGGARRRVG